MATRRRTPRWMLRESYRALVTMALSMPLTYAVVIALDGLSLIKAKEGVWLSVLVGWVAFATLHSLATWLVFRGLRGSDLTDALAVEGTARAKRRGILRSRWYRAFFASDSGTSWAAQLALMALIGVGILLLNRSLRTPSLIIAGGALVVASWVNVWVVYAVQYAHLELKKPGFRFTGDPALGAVERSFSDYLYVSLAVQATFATSDVGVETAAMRRAVMPHVLITFAFNSVIVALLVSLVIGGL